MPSTMFTKMGCLNSVRSRKSTMVAQRLRSITMGVPRAALPLPLLMPFPLPEIGGPLIMECRLDACRLCIIWGDASLTTTGPVQLPRLVMLEARLESTPSTWETRREPKRETGSESVTLTGATADEFGVNSSSGIGISGVSGCTCTTTGGFGCKGCSSSSLGCCCSS